MKKIFLLLFSFVSGSLLADDIPVAVSFDFEDPQSLGFDPPLSSLDLNYLKGSGDVLNLTTRVIKGGDVTISFGLGGFKEGAAINHVVSSDDDNYSFYTLSLRTNATMTFSVPDGCSLESIVFEGGLATLSEVVGDPGYFNFSGKTWYSNGQEATRVSFQNGQSYDTRITAVHVKYSRPPKPLTLLSVTPSDNSLLDAPFSSMQLRFDMPVSIANESGFTVQGDALDGQVRLVPTASGETVTLAAPAPITTNGVYTVTIPSGRIVNSEGSWNARVITRFRLQMPLLLDSIVPAAGTVLEALPDTVHFYFRKKVKVDGDIRPRLLQNGAQVGILRLSADPDNGMHVFGKVENLEGDLKAESLWTVVVPEKAVHSVWYGVDDNLDSWNSEIRLQYQVEKLNHHALLEARELIGHSGVGYPKAESAARAALQEAIDKDATKEQLEAAMAAFYADADILMPVDSAWYLIAGVNNADVPSKVYLRYADGRVSLTTAATGATPFQAIAKGGAYLLRTSDKSHFLHVLTTRGDLLEASPANVTAKESFVNNFNVARLRVEGGDSTRTFGRLSLSGVLLTLEGERIGRTATIDHAAMRIFDADRDTVYFSAGPSSAFVFEETAAPYDPALYVRPGAYLSSGGAISEGETLLVSITNVQKATLARPENPYILYGGSKVQTEGQVLIPTASDNVFEVNTKGLSAGSYTLVMPVGTFAYENKERLVSDVELRLGITVNKYVEPEPDFQYTYNSQISCMQTLTMLRDGITIVADTDLNELELFANIGNPYSGMIPDTTKVVEIVNYYNPSLVYGRGHFVPYPRIEKDYPEFGLFNVQAIKLVVDEPIKKGDIGVATVTYVIPRATFGDANFGKWLNDNKSVSPEDCIVNDRIANLIFHVNNNYAIEREPRLKGDVNRDKVVDVADIAAIIADMSGVDLPMNADVNGDNVVDVADIATVIDVMSTNEQ